MTLERLLIIALSTWYLSHALTATSGPGNIFAWARENIPHGRTKVLVEAGIIDGKPYTKWEWGKNGVLDCVICAAPWIALGLWLVPDGVIVWALAAAGLALLAHGLAGWRYNT